MIDAISIYNHLKEDFPEVQAFHLPLEEAYSLPSSSGKKIDLANTIFECIGKNAWRRTPNAPSDDKIEKASIKDMLAGAKPFFKKNDPDFYDEVYEALVSTAGRILGNRSTKGDLSHGHLHTKADLNAAHATMSLNLALSFASYYFLVYEQALGKMCYDDHAEVGQYNDWLNAKGSKIGGASYSWLVYQHDYTGYEDSFDEYQLEEKEKAA